MNAFPILSRKPARRGFTDEKSNEAVLIGSMASGYPVMNKQFTFDPRTFAFDLASLSDADKLTLMAFYEANKDVPFYWPNIQDAIVYEVAFVSPPRCVNDGRDDLWRAGLVLRPTSTRTISNLLYGLIVARVAYWKLNDDEADTVVLDWSGNLHTGILAGGDNTADKSIVGKVGKAFALNGTDDYVDSNSPFQENFRGSFSFSLWMKPTDGQPVADEMLLGVVDSTGDDSVLHIGLAPDGTLRYGYGSEGPKGNNAYTNSPVFPDGATVWTHVVFTADSVINGIGGKKIYVGGVEVDLDPAFNGSTAGVDFSLFTLVQNLFIGAYNSNGANISHFDGGLDDVMFFDRVLTDTEIAWLALGEQS